MPRRPRQPAVDPALVDAFVEAVNEGETACHAAERLGLPVYKAATLYQAATGRTVTATRAEARERRIAQVAYAFDAGATVEEIAALIGRSTATVTTLLAVAGRDTNPRRRERPTERDPS